MMDILDVIFLQPLMVIYKAVFYFPDGLSLGGRIIAFSLMLNLILSPLYREMELRARKGRERSERMNGDVVRMKTHFHGRERYFYIRAVHRQYGYHPIQSLLTSSELFLQIMVFASVYYFLSNLPALQGADYGQIKDLGRPDGMFGGINFLPLLMTGINMISVLYYVTDRKKRLQGIALALFFLVLLYGSPAGLVLYWTINNFWSLVRNMVLNTLQKKGEQACTH